jgi:uncharacterized protein YqhQ
MLGITTRYVLKSVIRALLQFFILLGYVRFIIVIPEMKGLLRIISAPHKTKEFDRTHDPCNKSKYKHQKAVQIRVLQVLEN